LDLKYQIELIEYLKEWAKENSRAVIGVLHDINLAVKLSENVMVMKNGEIQAYGKTSEIIGDELLKKVYEIDVARYMRESLKRWEVIKK
jgi:iron complex transport system ATP-binding protein